MSYIDLSGLIIGDFIVLERDFEYGKNKNLKDWNKKTYWKCKCLKCNEISVKSKDVLKNKKSLNLCRKCNSLRIKIGEKYGFLVVQSKNLNYKKENKIKSNRAYYNCLCECGQIIVRSSDYLLNSKLPNCGCKNKENIRNLAEKRIKDLTEEKFGLLTVIEKDDYKSSPGNIFWKVQCECGKIFSVSGKHLKRGATISCGCIKRSIGEIQIERLLIQNGINFQREYPIKELQNKRFDFAIFDDNNNLIRLIEFDGEQHFTSSSFFAKNDLSKIKERDNIKNNWAISNNIPLVRISYKYRNKITYNMLFNDNSFLINNEMFNDHQLKY